MRTRLADVVAWKGRNIPGDRVIPDHLKLAILTRGRVNLPAGNIAWLVDVARVGGTGWPDRLRRDLSEITPQVHVVVELFSNQRPEMRSPEITEVFTGYLALRRQRHYHRHILLFRWLPHTGQRELEDKLGLDISLLFRKARVRAQPARPDRFLLLVYACLPDAIERYVAPVRPQPPPVPSTAMPPLEGLTSPSTAKNLRDEPSESAKSFGEQVGAVVPVRVLEKREGDGHLWFRIELGADLDVVQNGQPAKLAAHSSCWIVGEEKVSPALMERLVLNKGPSRVGGGLEWVAAPWDFFRHQLREFESANASLGLDDRITKLRQMSHPRGTPFDAVIGSRAGTDYLDTQPFVPDRWQLLKDYQAVRAPDGRLVDLHHLLVGLDVLRRPEILSKEFATLDIGSNWGAATWAGDLGAGASDMKWRAAKEWEKRRQRDFATRARYYFETRAGDHDLIADLDAWGIHALRSPDRTTIDDLVASYYGHTVPDGLGTVTSARRDGLRRFLAHYGFTYDLATDYQNYPAMPRQRKPRARVRSEIFRFARIWSLRSKPLEGGAVDESAVDAMTLQFLYWLEYQTIENGASVEP
jgi:hypothetical protein